MNDRNFQQIQSDLDMQLLTQMQIQRDLQNMRGGPTQQEIEASRQANRIIAMIVIAVIGGIALIVLLT